MLLCLVLALLLYLPTGLDAAQETGKNAAGKTKNDLARVQERIRTLEKQNRQDLARRGQLDRQLRDAETAAARVRKELNTTRRELAEGARELAELTRQLEATRAELEKQRGDLAGQLRLAHITGGSEQVRAIFNQEDPAELGRRLTWLGFLARSRSELLGSIQAGLEALDRDRQAVEEQQSALVALEAQRSEQLAKLDSARQDRSTVIASLDSQVKGQKQQLSRARDQAAGLQRVLRELERAAANARRQAPQPGKPSAAPMTGKPLGKGRWPVEGQLLADFGQPRAGGQMRWDGVLIAATAGSEVRAIRSGKVVYADWLPGLGLLLVLDHGGGYLSLYGHNQDLTRDVGDRLAVGDVIAHVGDTGGQSRSALYFEVRRNGRPLNPRQWVN
jgi:septal ring factor EnvC (AmiA/AmiB activator)